jgi:hypothetical protein
MLYKKGQHVCRPYNLMHNQHCEKCEFMFVAEI